MTDYWSDYLACSSVCGARTGKPCFALSSGGPEALPPVFTERAHSSRPTREGAAAKRAESATKAPRVTTGAPRNPAARRAVSKTQTLADQWRAKAAKQKEK